MKEEANHPEATTKNKVVAFYSPLQKKSSTRTLLAGRHDHAHPPSTSSHPRAQRVRDTGR